MVISKGYKQSEVGVIPDCWDVKSLGQLATISGGGTPSTSNPVFWHGEINWFTPTEIGLNKYSSESCRKITKLGLENCSARLLPKGTILLTTRASIGDMSILLNEATTNQGFQSLIPNKELDNEFLYYTVSMRKRLLIQNASGSTFLEISPDKVKSIPIPIPPTLTEQTAISTALSDTDNLIISLEKLINKKLAIKQGAMHQLLKPKEDWETKKLGEVIVDFQNGYGFSASGYVSSGIPIVTMAQIGLDGTFNFDETKVNKWKPQVFNSLKNFHLKDGDLIIAMTDVTPEKNLIGRMAIVNTDQTLLLNQRVGLLKLDPKKANAYVLKTLSNMRDWRTYCIGSASLGVQANLGTSDILNGEISIPKIEEQEKIAQILSDMDIEISAIKRKLIKFKLLKQGMMQELLTGKTRLI